MSAARLFQVAKKTRRAFGKLRKKQEDKHPLVCAYTSFVSILPWYPLWECQSFSSRPSSSEVILSLPKSLSRSTCFAQPQLRHLGYMPTALNPCGLPRFRKKTQHGDIRMRVNWSASLCAVLSISLQRDSATRTTNINLFCHTKRICQQQIPQIFHISTLCVDFVDNMHNKMESHPFWGARELGY